jgi:hypothetical protein
MGRGIDPLRRGVGSLILGIGSLLFLVEMVAVVTKSSSVGDSGCCGDGRGDGDGGYGGVDIVKGRRASAICIRQWSQ